MTYSALAKHFTMVLASAALSACAPKLDTNQAVANAPQSSTFNLVDQTQPSFFDGKHMVRSFDPGDLKGLRVKGDRFNITLFDGISHAFEVTRVNFLKDAGVSWFGSVDDDKYSHFSVTYRDNTAVGSALIGGVSYTIRTSKKGNIEVAKLTIHDTVDCEADHQHLSVKGVF
jgi:hypothetical protein